MFTGLPKMLLDGMVHEIGLQGCLGLGLDLELRLPARGVTHEPHRPVLSKPESVVRPV